MAGETDARGIRLRCQSLAHSTGYLPCSRFAAQVAGVQGGIGGDLLYGCHQTLCSGVLTQVFEQHHAAPERAHGVGQALAHDVKGRAMDGLEHAGVAALGVDVAGGRNAQAARQRGGQVREDVGVQVGSDDGVERGRAVDHASGGSVYQFLVPLHIRKLLADLQRNLVPHHHGVALGVALGDHRQLLARA